MSSIAGGIDGLEPVFDDASLVADAGLLVAGTLIQRLDLEAPIDAAVRPPGAGRGSGAKALTAVASMLVGGSFIDDVERLRAGSSGAAVLVCDSPLCDIHSAWCGLSRRWVQRHGS